MTLRYAHLSPVHKRSAMELLGMKMDTFWTPDKNLEQERKTETVKTPQLLENFDTTEGSHSGLVRRFAKPLYGLTTVSRVRISPPPE